jgi:urate oxidase
MTSARITYGKLEVPVQRVSEAGLLAARVSMEVLGQRFLAAYTEGDNAEVVATTWRRRCAPRARARSSWPDWIARASAA